jgi:AraC-like DNA-binding protein
MGDRECVLPTGAMHLAFRLSSQPFRFFNDVEDTAGQAFGHAIVGGARAAPYVREVSGPARSVGALLHPGACNLLFGVTADELAGRHTALDELWGPWVAETRERLLAAGSPAQQLDLFESFLAARLPRVHGLHPAVAHALERFAMTSDVREVVRQTGYSHRRFIALFRQAVGLTPKLYCRVLRFQRTLERMAADPAPALVELALEAGYSDQAHFNREFREFTGLTPEEYRERSPSLPYHVPVRQPER